MRTRTAFWTTRPRCLGVWTRTTAATTTNRSPSYIKSPFFRYSTTTITTTQHEEERPHSIPDLLFNPTIEHRTLRQSLRQFVQDHVEPQAHFYNKHETFNHALFVQMAEQLGIVGSLTTTFYNDATAVALVHEELSYSDPAFGLSYLAHTVLCAHNLYMNGTDEQKQQFLPLLMDGSCIGGMAMSEPSTGTDVLGMQTKAVPATTTTSSHDDHHSHDWILNGRKMWITNGTIDGTNTGDIFLVYAKTGPQKTDITLFLVTKQMEGFTLGQKIGDKLGMRASMTAELVFDHVRIPSTHVVGQVHHATLCMMRNLEIERVALAAMSIGIARRCIDEMKAYATQRTAFGQPLTSFGQIQKQLAESYARYMAGKTYLYSLCRTLDLESTGNGLDTDAVKLYNAQMAKEVADCAIQVMGGYGYVGEYVVERLWRDAKLLEIGGGTNESHHKNMTRDLKKRGKLD